MGSLMIGTFASLVGSMNLDFVLKLAANALEKGHEVSLWLSGNSTVLVNKDQKEFKDYSHPGIMLPDLIDKGLKVVVCEACAMARGVPKEKAIDGVTYTSMDWYLAYGAKGDRLLHIGRE